MQSQITLGGVLTEVQNYFEGNFLVFSYPEASVEENKASQSPDSPEVNQGGDNTTPVTERKPGKGIYSGQ